MNSKQKSKAVTGAVENPDFISVLRSDKASVEAKREAEQRFRSHMEALFLGEYRKGFHKFLGKLDKSDSREFLDRTSRHFFNDDYAQLRKLDAKDLDKKLYTNVYRLFLNWLGQKNIRLSEVMPIDVPDFIVVLQSSDAPEEAREEAKKKFCDHAKTLLMGEGRRGRYKHLWELTEPDRDDCFQDFIEHCLSKNQAVLRTYGKNQPPLCFAAWLFEVSKNHCLKWKEKSNRQLRATTFADIGVDGADEAEISSRISIDFTQSRRTERRSIVELALRKLTRRCQLVLRFRMDGYANKDWDKFVERCKESGDLEWLPTSNKELGNQYSVCYGNLKALLGLK